MRGVPSVPRMLIASYGLLAALSGVVAILPAKLHIIGDCSEHAQEKLLWLPLLAATCFASWSIVAKAAPNLVGTSFDRGLVLGGAAALCLFVFSPFILSELFALIGHVDLDMQSTAQVGITFALIFIGVILLFGVWTVLARALLGAAYQPVGSWFALVIFACAAGFLLTGLKLPGPFVVSAVICALLIGVTVSAFNGRMRDASRSETCDMPKVFAGLAMVTIAGAVMVWNAFGLVHRVTTMQVATWPVPSPYAGTKWSRQPDKPEISYIGPWRIDSTRSDDRMLITVVAPYGNGDTRGLQISIPPVPGVGEVGQTMYLRIARAGERIPIVHSNPAGTCFGWKPGGSDPLHYELLNIPPSTARVAALSFMKKFVAERVKREF